MNWNANDIEAVLSECKDRSARNRYLKRLGLDMPVELGWNAIEDKPLPTRFEMAAIIYDDCLATERGTKNHNIKALVTTAMQLGLIATPTLDALRNFMCGE